MKSAFAQPLFVSPDGSSHSLEPIFITPNSSYDEAWLQGHIHAHPECLPVREIENGFDRPIAICRELQTAHGPIDNFLMTADGDLILVETKLWKNAEARRTVVAQALDYASCLFALTYEELERAVLAIKSDHQPPRRKLFDFFADNEVDEATFIDAVSRNLKLGRAVLLIVGDGIRSEMAQLATLLQGNPAFNFTFALVEMGIFKLASDQGFVLCPKVLAKTEMIQRAVVVIEDQRVSVRTPSPALGKASATPENIAAAQFYDAMARIDPSLPDKLRKFLAQLESLGVHPDFQKSLNLRWTPPEGRTISFGYKTPAGEIWTDTANYRVPADLGHRYNEDLANAWGGQIRKPTSGAWSVQLSGRAPRISQVSDQLIAWLGAIERHLEHVKNLTGD